MADIKFDNLIDALFSRAKHITTTVGKKTTETVESAKLKFAISETEAKVSECKKKIGDIIYKEYLKTKDFDGELGEICKTIENLTDDIEVMKDKLAEVKNSRRCPKCGSLNDDRNTFCAVCGAILNNEGESGYERQE